ncbi:cobalamin biosynthesis protein [Streptomyces pristinaespiralis]|uniref:cobalamin biosynthesis protein n=1 Tax=Streptomyces pristinaespiralis TaxID=38300 RepID=UPI0038339874
MSDAVGGSAVGTTDWSPAGTTGGSPTGGAAAGPTTGPADGPTHRPTPLTTGGAAGGAAGGATAAGSATGAAGGSSAGPRGLVVGVGASRGVPVDEVHGLVEEALREAGLSTSDVVALATLDAKAAEPGVLGAAERLGVPLWTYGAERLARVPVENPSPAALRAVGTPSVAEAAALAGGGELLVPKRRSAPAGRPAGVTCAIARLGSRTPSTTAVTRPQRT